VRKRHRQSAVVALVAAGVLALTACGTSLSHQRIVDAASGGAVATGSNGSANDASGGSATDSGSGAAVGSSGTTGGTGGGSGGGGGGSNDATGGGSATPTGAGSGGGGANCAANQSQVVLGNIGSYSGLAGAALPGSQPAIQAWSQWVNAHGGLHCHPVKLVSADDGADPARALSLAKDMVESQGAIGFVSDMVPLTISGIRPYVEQQGVPVVGGDVSLADWIQSPMLFPSGTDADSFRQAQVREFASAGLNKLAILYCGETPSCSQGANYIINHPPPGVQIVYSAEISVAQTNFTTECLQAKNKGATALYVASEGNSLIHIARDCAQQSYKPRFSAASIAVLPQMASIPSLDGMIALIGNAPWFETNTTGVREFRQAMAQYAPNAPITAAALAAFASGLIVQKAASSFGAHPTAKDLVSGLDALQGYTADGLTPPLTYHAGQGSGPVPCYFLITVQNGNWVAPNGANAKCL
jgi:branched-chain amino acid transport system substrate-binding protein